MGTIIQILMYFISAVTLITCKPNLDFVPTSTIFKAGMISMISLFGMAWMFNTLFANYMPAIKAGIKEYASHGSWVIFLAVFIVALSSSQSAATAAVIPVAMALNIRPELLAVFWVAGFCGAIFLPINGPQITATNMDITGSTTLGTKVLNHSFMIPILLLTAGCLLFGTIFSFIF
jgi:anaerobic C4-dicarboxylate transporter DcuA/anaerobic C4-dicarboxylate transporter DcuB